MKASGERSAALAASVCARLSSVAGACLRVQTRRRRATGPLGASVRAPRLHVMSWEVSLECVSAVGSARGAIGALSLRAGPKRAGRRRYLTAAGLSCSTQHPKEACRSPPRLIPAVAVPKELSSAGE